MYYRANFKLNGNIGNTGPWNWEPPNLPVSFPGAPEDDDEPDKVEDEEASATEEEESEVDNETHFGYDPDREVDVWVEYQAVMQDPMFAY